jgi:hypothetical protein
MRTIAILTPVEVRVTVIHIAVEIENKLKNPTITEMTMSRPGNPAGLSLVIVGPSKYLISFLSVCTLKRLFAETHSHKLPGTTATKSPM